MSNEQLPAYLRRRLIERATRLIEDSQHSRQMERDLETITLVATANALNELAKILMDYDNRD